MEQKCSASNEAVSSASPISSSSALPLNNKQGQFVVFDENLISAARKEKKAGLVLKNARIPNVFTGQMVEGDIAIEDGRIAGIGFYEGEQEIDLNQKTVLPGLIDAHFHIESTMATPSALSQVLLSHGVCTVIADPHEIVNAAGKAGLDFMLEDAGKAAVDYFFMIPSSVPSCDFEINGAGEFTASDMEEYAGRKVVLGLAEVMRMQDVLERDSRMKAKFELFQDQIIDGHAPGLHKHDLQAYRAAGVRNDHEAANSREAIERLQSGFQLLIRQGSGAKNLEPILKGLLEQNIRLDHCSLCTDDKHIEDIVEEGTIDDDIRTAIAIGCDPIDALRMASLNTADHYGLKDRGAIAPGYLADLVVVDDLSKMNIVSVWKNGNLVFEAEKDQNRCKDGSDSDIDEIDALISIPAVLQDSVILPDFTLEDLECETGLQDGIEMVPNQLYTRHFTKNFHADEFPSQTYNVLFSAERYGKTGEYALSPLSGFGLKNGAIAMSYAHDSHNVVAAADNTEDLLLAIETLKKNQGGIVLVADHEVFDSLPMEAAGLMSSLPAETIAARVEKMKAKAIEMGVRPGIDPFANLSFLSLPVIPEVRLTPQGVYDTRKSALIKKGKRK